MCCNLIQPVRVCWYVGIWSGNAKPAATEAVAISHLGSKSNSFCSPVRRELALKTSWTGGSDAPVISMKSLAPDVPQLDKGLSFSQQIESVNPASLVQSVGPLDVNGTWKIADHISTACREIQACQPVVGHCWGRRLQRQSKCCTCPSLVANRWNIAGWGQNTIRLLGSAFALRETLCTPTAVVLIGAHIKHILEVNLEAKDQVTLISEWRRCPRNWSSVSYLIEPNISFSEAWNGIPRVEPYIHWRQPGGGRNLLSDVESIWVTFNNNCAHPCHPFTVFL